MARLYESSTDYQEHITYAGATIADDYDNPDYLYDREQLTYDGGTTAVLIGYASPNTTYGQSNASYTPKVVARTATGNGVGSDIPASFFRGYSRTATGTGTGSDTPATFFREHVRTGTGSGTGSDTPATFFRGYSRTGTGTGAGSDTPATWSRLYLFRTPTDNQVDFTGSDYYHGNMIPANRLIWQLYRHYTPGPRGRNVWKLTDGTYTENQPPDDTDIDIIYLGGHDHHVDATERAALIAAGYGDYVN